MRKIEGVQNLEPYLDSLFALRASAVVEQVQTEAHDQLRLSPPDSSRQKDLRAVVEHGHSIHYLDTGFRAKIDGQRVEVYIQGAHRVKAIGDDGNLVWPSQHEAYIVALAQYNAGFATQTEEVEQLRQQEGERRLAVQQTIDRIYSGQPNPPRLQANPIASIIPRPVRNFRPADLYQGALVDEGDTTGMTMKVGKILIVGTTHNLTLPDLVHFKVNHEDGYFRVDDDLRADVQARLPDISQRHGVDFTAPLNPSFIANQQGNVGNLTNVVPSFLYAVVGPNNFGSGLDRVLSAGRELGKMLPVH